MTPQPAIPTIEKPLYGQLVVMAGVFFVLGYVCLDWRWGASGAAGVAAAIGYYMLLAAQVRRQFARGFVPSPFILVMSLALRQLICLAVPGACAYYLGQPAWLGSLVTLFIARHWIVVVAWPRAGQAPRQLATLNA